MPYVVAALSLVVLWLISGVFAGAWNPWKLVEGADKRPSTSKFQWWLWTVVVFFSYVAIYASRVRLDHFEALSEIPQNVLIALGMSAGTMAISKAITVGYVNTGKIEKTEPVGASPAASPSSSPGPSASPSPTPTTVASGGPGGLLQDDANYPELSKIQLIAWTLVAVVVFLIAVVNSIENASSSSLAEIPDIDPSLVVLMGLGQGAYLGKKLVTTSTLRLAGINPGAGPAGTSVTLSGVGLGTLNGNQVTIAGSPIVGVDSWNDTEVSFRIPATHPGGRDWTSGGELVQMGVIASGNVSNTLPFTIEVA